MIEVVQTKSLLPAIKWNGNFICSSIDPMLEAQKWVDKNKTRIIRQKQVIVLGVGCGHHLVALQKNFPGLHILAVDVQNEFIQFAQREHALELSNVVFVNAHTANSFKSNPRLLSALNSRYAVLVFAPAHQKASALYMEFEELLLGRTDAGANFLCQVRKELSSLLTGRHVKVASDSLISIKTLDGAIVQETNENMVLKIKILKEMIN
ncbi:MAG: hypothetical protein KDD38_00415 [Bdellovibrionales bacterium]|nr:hypothetical protein [Bdellovibrionales bacterium]